MPDAYRKWLGIPEGRRPPNHYQLLGIAGDETDREVIESVVLRQTAFVRHYQSGPQARECARILTELAQARLTLIDPMKRAAYDAGLFLDDQSPPHSEGPAPPIGLLALDTGPPAAISGGKRRHSRGAFAKVAIHLAITGCALTVIFLSINKLLYRLPAARTPATAAKTETVPPPEVEIKVADASRDPSRRGLPIPPQQAAPLPKPMPEIATLAQSRPDETPETRTRATRPSHPRADEPKGFAGMEDAPEGEETVVADPERKLGDAGRTIAAAGAGDPTGEKLESARKSFKSRMNKLRASVLKEFDRIEESYRKAGKLQAMKKIKVEREAFLSGQDGPSVVPLNVYRNESAKAREEMVKAYRLAIKNYVRSKDIDAASRIETELEEFVGRAIPVVGKWKHRTESGLPLVTELFADGRIFQGGKQTGIWYQMRSRLIMRYPNVRAPGGEFIDDVILSKDGLHYDGKNQLGVGIHGQRVGL